jgi:hypothetical protein
MSKYPQIYALQDPITESIRYIGKAKNPAERFKKHLIESRSGRRSHYPVYQWMNKLSREGLLPKLIVLASSISMEWEILETEMISQHRQELGRTLLNVADGGDQPRCSDEQRKVNALKMNAVLDARGRHSPIKRGSTLAKAHYLKKRVAYYINHIDRMPKDKAESFLNKLRDAGAKRPDLFGEYRYL